MNGLTEKQKIEHIKKIWKFTINMTKVAYKTVLVYQEISKDFVVHADGDFSRCTKNQKLAMFGTTEDILYKEKALWTQKPKWYIMTPEKNFYMVWNLIVVVLLCYIATVMPYRIAFVEETTLGWEIWNYLSDFLFLIDVFVNCISAYDREDGTLETRVSKIICNYAKGWMTLDVVACLPFQLLGIAFGLNFDGSKAKLLRLARLPRLYKLIRIFRVFKFVKILKKHKKIKPILDFFSKYSGFLRLFKTCLYAFIMIHFISCLWYGVAKNARLAPDTWVARGGYQDKSAFYLYMLSVYWALQTLTTVGFGDITAKTKYELIITIFWMIFGVIFYSITVSNLTSIISSLDVSESRTQAYLNNLHEFAMRVELPEETKSKVRTFIEVNSKSSDNSEYQETLLKDLPSSLRSEVIAHTHGEIIRKIIFFRDKDIRFLWKVLPMLKPLKVLIDEIIYNQQEKGKEMYFILKGRVKLWYNLASKQMALPIRKGLNQYVEGSYIGDHDLFTGVHDATAIPSTEVNLLVLSKMSIKKLLEKGPDEMKTFIRLAKIRKTHHQKLIIRSLQKDKEAFKLLQASQKLDEIDRKSPIQFIVKNLRTYLDSLSDKNEFEEKINRIINLSTSINYLLVDDSDSEENDLAFEISDHGSESRSNSSDGGKSISKPRSRQKSGGPATCYSPYKCKHQSIIFSKQIKKYGGDSVINEKREKTFECVSNYVQ
jgi:CRP-like cAMP-binding protein